jgi:ATP-dependent 26S proteasome regulatory subunit
VAVFCKTDNFDDFDKCITALREIESDTSILVIVEDIDSITNNYDTQLCELLDGTTSSVEGICYLLTTNDIDKIPDRIKNRPSRIDVKIKIGPPDLPTRINFIEQFTKKVNFSINLSTYANKLDGFSFAKIKEFLIGVIIYKHSPETMISKLGE